MHSTWGMMRDFEDTQDRDNLPPGYIALARGHVDRLKAEIHVQVVEVMRIARLIYDADDSAEFRAITAAAGTIEGETAAEDHSEALDDRVHQRVAMALSLLKTKRWSRAGRAVRQQAPAELDDTFITVSEASA